MVAARSLIPLSLLLLVSCNGTPTPPPDIVEYEIVEYAMPYTGIWLSGITAGPSPDDHVWFTAFTAEVGRVSATDTTPQLYTVPGASKPDIAVGSDNHLWITRSNPPISGEGHTVIGITTSGTVYAVYVLPYVPAIDDPLSQSGSKGRWLWAITAADNGYLYFTERYASRIGCFKPGPSPTRCGENADWPADWPTATPDSDPTDITQGPDGNLYFTEHKANKIGCLTPTGSYCGEWPAPGAPYGITVGPDGHLWFTESDGDKIGRFNLTSKTVDVEVPLTAGSQPSGITQGPPGDYAVWFTEKAGNKIARLSVLALEVFHYPPQEFLVPTPKSEPTGITVGPDHHIWFVESIGNKIGVVIPVSP
jgi:streptogramin lyase